ncbi:MAG: lipid-A-disaccharide synthase N-terminal domain-containing protein [Planctomycetota bacterium]
MIVEVLAKGGDTALLQPILEWFELEEAWRLWLVAFGLVGQVVFCARWIIQWIASEVRGESHMPVLFWWASLLGATMLLTYFIIDRDPVGIVGQGTGWLVYSRNLYLIRKKGDGSQVPRP